MSELKSQVESLSAELKRRDEENRAQNSYRESHLRENQQLTEQLQEKINSFE